MIRKRTIDMEIIALSILLLISASDAQITQEGQCEDIVELQENFNIEEVTFLIFIIKI